MKAMNGCPVPRTEISRSAGCRRPGSTGPARNGRRWRSGTPTPVPSADQSCASLASGVSSVARREVPADRFWPAWLPHHRLKRVASAAAGRRVGVACPSARSARFLETLSLVGERGGPPRRLARRLHVAGIVEVLWNPLERMGQQWREARVPGSPGRQARVSRNRSPRGGLTWGVRGESVRPRYRVRARWRKSPART